MAAPSSLRIKQALTSSCRAKIARADEHLDTLYRETDGWGDGDPFVVTRESQPDGRVHVFRLRYKVQPDVWRWAILLGDALYDLRCALDHIVYALAINQTGKDPPDDETSLAFPICSEPRFFEKASRRIASLNKPTQAAIEKAQPYNRLKPGEWFMSLWWLSQLNDTDKHRSAHLAVTAGHPDDIATDAIPGTFRALWNRGPLVDGAPILQLTLAEPDPNVYVDLKTTGAVVLQAEGFPPISLYHLTRHIRREVVLVCRYLSRCFV
ncbi:MAG: hypothetical protein ACRDJ4_10620 [Actinomycetota bacterium]